jgi:filamentous hemagglutinin
VELLIKGLQDYNYQLPKLDKQGNLTGDFKKPVKDPKTVYDPKILPDSLILDLGQKASAKELKNLAAGDEQFSAIAGGMKFRVYVDKGTMNIRNFHPEI